MSTPVRKPVLSGRDPIGEDRRMTQQADIDGIHIVSEEAFVVISFLRALERGDLDAALDLVADDLVYENVGFPTVRGKAGLAKAFGPLAKSGKAGFAVHFHHVATDGDVVMTDRIDELSVGSRFAARFWVYGRFTVRDGHIAIWRDHFDVFDVTKGVVRAIAGIAAPSVNRRMPAR
jgi:limonene-1,2-epoxide hydrolase